MTTYLAVHAGTIFTLLLVFAILLMGGFTTGYFAHRNQMTWVHILSALSGILAASMLLLGFML